MFSGEQNRMGRGAFGALLVVAALATGCPDRPRGGQPDVADPDAVDFDADVPTDIPRDRADVEADIETDPPFDAMDVEVGPTCGNGVVEEGEQCDDGNNVNGDGCQNDCTWTCDPMNDTCPPEQHCDERMRMCVPGCRDHAGCAEPTPFCLVEEHRCVECIGAQGCDPGFVCIDNACVPGCSDTHPCPAGLECCGGGCVDTDISLSHCGACDSRCEVANGTPACVAGTCAVAACDAGYADCNGNVADGCEIATDTDLENCGACGNVCMARANATVACTDGVCEFTCQPPFADCNGMAEDGCEADTRVDVANCGACGNACLVPSGTPGCVDGACTVGACEPGYGDCNGSAADGCEVNTSTDLSNCGSCGNACGTPANGTSSCIEGVCTIDTCNPGYADCDREYRTGCETRIEADPANCGACGNVCSVPNATAACARGLCTIGSCNAGYRDCNDAIADGCEIHIATDLTNCGACGNVCPQPANGLPACTAGSCGIASCNTGYADCNGSVADGCETDITSSTAHCGACRNVCPTPYRAAAVCTGGVCGMGACHAGFGDCNADAEDGCETRLNTILDCGACGRACSMTFGTPSCSGTPPTCRITCHTGYGNCDGNVDNGCEVDHRTDNAHCGSCGTACTGGRVCVGGTCRFAPPPNDERSGAIVIPWASQSTTLTTNTAGATNNTGPVPGCGCTSGRDVFYTFTVPPGGNHIVYADTIGTTWDTSLFLQDSEGYLLTSAGMTGGLVCSNDGGLGCSIGTQSMIAALLGPGTYYLVLSGCGSGEATIRFQHLRVGNGPVEQLPQAAGIQTITGSTSGTGLYTTSACGGTGPENTYWFVTCPTFAAQSFTASTVGGANWDTVLDQWSAARTSPAADVCNDNQCLGVQSTVTSMLPAGAGLHALYVDGHDGGSGSYTLWVLFGGCPVGQTLCGNVCRALQTDLDNCGCCNNVCPTRPNSTRTCTAGTCGFNCHTGWGDCDGVAANGCETDTTSSNAHCGACGVACPAGTSCVASLCRPNNDRCAGAIPINLGLGTQITISGTTLNAYHDIAAPAACVVAPNASDVYYSFTLTARSLVYVHSFGSAYDTVLFFARTCTAPLTGITTAGDRLCDNDRGGICTGGGTGSQIVALLAPGTYYVVVSGAGGASGAFDLVFQHIRAGNGIVGPIAPGANTLSGITSGTGVVTQPCASPSGPAPEDTYWWRTCPEFVSATFAASTCGGATWDTVLALVSGSGVGNLCNDDMHGDCGLQSAIRGPIPAGAGLHVMYIDGYDFRARGRYTIVVARP